MLDASFFFVDLFLASLLVSPLFFLREPRVRCADVDRLCGVEVVWALLCDAKMAEPGFWDERQGKSYATLMKIDHVSVIDPVPCRKRDRRGWVVMRSSNSQDTLF